MSSNLDRFALTGRVAVVTGASEGIGRDLAPALAEAGADLVLCSRSEGKLREVQAEMAGTGREVEVFPLDLRKIGEIEGLKAFCLSRFGRVDVLVNSAGYVVTKPAWAVTEEDWDGMLDVGLKGLFFCCQVIGSIMREQNYGKIINLGSTLGQSTVVGRSVYGAAKAGVARLTRALATEWACHGIRVNALAPTAVRTPSREGSMTAERLQSLTSRIPMGRLATTDDLIGAAIFLASEASDFITGQTIYVDGGWIAAS